MENYTPEIELDLLSKLFDIEISLPRHKFELVKKFKNCAMPLDKASEIDKTKIFSSAITRKNFVNMSLN